MTHSDTLDKQASTLTSAINLMVNSRAERLAQVEVQKLDLHNSPAMDTRSDLSPSRGLNCSSLLGNTTFQLGTGMSR